MATVDVKGLTSTCSSVFHPAKNGPRLWSGRHTAPCLRVQMISVRISHEYIIVTWVVSVARDKKGWCIDYWEDPIRFSLGHFLLVVLWNQTYISNGFRDIERQM